MSRSTFHEAQHDIAWQKQLRDRYSAEGVPPVPSLDLKRALVRPVSRRLAEQIILKYEWLGTMAGTTWHYGLFYGDYCAGVCCIGGASVLAGPYVYQSFGIERAQLAVLARGACVHWAPAGSNSKLVSWSARLLAREQDLKVLIAYSDTEAGEIGTIYQACNWIYIGFSHNSHWEFIAPSGRVLNGILLTKYARAAKMSNPDYLRLLQERGWTRQKPNPKHRYVYLLDKSDHALLDRVEQMRQPYPKRAGSIAGDAATLQVAEDSSTLIPALPYTLQDATR